MIVQFSFCKNKKTFTITKLSKLGVENILQIIN